jgi:Flp pilus assembly protein TadB
MAAHECVQGPKLESLEAAIGDIREGQKKTDGKLDKITELLVSDAHTQEQLKHIKETQRDHEDRLRSVETRTNTNSGFTTRAERFFWIVVTGGIGTLWYIAR